MGVSTIGKSLVIAAAAFGGPRCTGQAPNRGTHAPGDPIEVAIPVIVPDGVRDRCDSVTVRALVGESDGAGSWMRVASACEDTAIVVSCPAVDRTTVRIVTVCDGDTVGRMGYEVRPRTGEYTLLEMELHPLPAAAVANGVRVRPPPRCRVAGTCPANSTGKEPWHI